MISVVMLTAWAFAIVALFISYRVFLRSGMGRFEALLFSTPFFTAPLFIAIGGAGSYIFAFDLAVPFLAMIAWRRLGEAPNSTKAAASLLFLGVGLIPLLMSVLHARTDRMNVLYSVVNAYRMLGSMSLLLCASTCRVRSDHQSMFHSGLPLLGYSGLAIVLMLATLAQGLGLVDSNVFYHWSGARELFSEEATGFAVVGLFRGSLGILGVMAVAAYLAVPSVRGAARLWLLLGAISGVAVIIACLSKTSLAVTGGLIGISILLSAIRGRLGKLATVLVGVLLGVPCAYLMYDYMPAVVQKTISGFLGGDEQYYATLAGRQSAWVQALDYVKQRPEIAIGGGLDQRYMGMNISVYHNEYLGVFMYGGIWSISAYAAGLGLLAVLLLRRRGTSALVSMAGFLMAAGVIQALTVDHILPGLYFVSCSALFALAYGLALHPLIAPGGYAGGVGIAAAPGDEWINAG